MQKRRRISSWVRVMAVLIGVPTLMGAKTLSEEAFRCEAALAHLEDCCPGFNAEGLNCDYDEGCESSSTYPDLSLDESNCLYKLSCSELRTWNYCDRLIAWAAGDRPAGGSVCP